MEAHDNRPLPMECSLGDQDICTDPMVLDVFVFCLDEIKIVQFASHYACIAVCV